MGHFAYLATAGPFAGLSDPARRRIGELFPKLSLVEIESASKSFLQELQAPVEPRLKEAREELNSFARELARFKGALNGIREHRLDKAIGEASRMIGGENELENLERSLNDLRIAIQRTSRALPLECAQIASRRLVARLARHMTWAGLSLDGTSSVSLLNLVDLIFQDLMVGGDATSAVKDWRKSEAIDKGNDPFGVLIDLVVPSLSAPLWNDAFRPVRPRPTPCGH